MEPSKMIDLITDVTYTERPLPFSIYSAKDEQVMKNVPIVNPLLIVVLGGQKSLGSVSEHLCASGQFVFLSDNPNVHMRNLPNPSHYFALVIEFERQDFTELSHVTNSQNTDSYYIGDVSHELNESLYQFIEFARWAPKELWSLRRKELLHVLSLAGHSDILGMVSNHKVSQKLHHIISLQPEKDLSLDTLCDELAMSESTLRRRLKSEGTSVQEIKDQVKLGLGLHLLQTTHLPISIISERCGYLSQSRFSNRFKTRFGLTPSDLRKTKLADLSESLTASE
ncbi:helix-turn-helix transcriptional regulator [Marinomonas balearica]|uniref:AraC family transcriptional regulator n=1 Tax=Marinomonas balearica TaxID=491947 RepID=A0A4R6MJX0_9GAMM|nr:AraC family transcriptional regulator [Marinomonas balearica]TDP01251.1 AraC family transcriptional regulator [Marinomonas balearica]